MGVYILGVIFPVVNIIYILIDANILCVCVCVLCIRVDNAIKLNSLCFFFVRTRQWNLKKYFRQILEKGVEIGYWNIALRPLEELSEKNKKYTKRTRSENEVIVRNKSIIMIIIIALKIEIEIKLE